MNETTEKRQGNFLTRLVRKQIFIPLAALLLLIIFNLVADPSFFAVTLKENSLRIYRFPDGKARFFVFGVVIQKRTFFL